MNTANTNTTATIGEATCNAMGGGGQGVAQDRAVTREPWWEEVGRLVDAFEAELAAAPTATSGTQATH